MRCHLSHIVCLILITVVASCSSDSENEHSGIIPITGAGLDITIVDDGDANKQEKINTIRFIVFNNITEDTKLDVNKYEELTEPGIATGIKRTLEVSPNDDKMVVVIINEPQTSEYSLKSILDAVNNPRQLEEIVYDIAEILESNNGQILASTGMPMIGVIRDISVEGGQTESVKMVVERAVARIDVYLRAKENGPKIGYTKDESRVNLHNLSYNSYFVMGNKENGTRDNAAARWKNYGEVMKDVSSESLYAKSWIATDSKTWLYNDPEGDKPVFLCSFYTAERIFHSDESDVLAISMNNFNKAGLFVGTAKRPIRNISNSGKTIPFTEIRRNNVYEITVLIGDISIEIVNVTVEDWGAAQNIDIGMEL